DGMVGLVVKLLHVGGLRISEVARLRVQDIDFEFKQITVWDVKGKKDWVTPLANNLILPLKIHLIKGWHPPLFRNDLLGVFKLLLSIFYY
ncbi:tyrosine-type recombinase/integrase, partial [Bathymodiolus thermophilus thioautotrophic gill symbiont]